MNYKKFGDNDYAICIDYNEDVMIKLYEFVEEMEIGFATFTAVGAFSKAVLGSFNAKKCEFTKHKMKGEHDFTLEVLSFTGNIAWNKENNKPIVHAHSAVSGHDGKVLGGHVFSGIVGVTFELHLKVLSWQEKHYRKDNTQFNFKFWDLN